jgi:anti-anti-sigma factor
LAWVTAQSRQESRLVALHGEVDMSNSTAIFKLLASAFSNDDDGVVIDLTDTQYFDSSGILLLLRFADALDRKRQQLVMVATPGGTVSKLLDISGISAKYLRFENTSADLEALAGGRRAGDV